MNRKIIFRGRDAKGTWHFGDLAHSQAVTETGLQPRVTVGGYEVDEKTIGQYWETINGFQLYDGDIFSIQTDKEKEKRTFIIEYIGSSMKIADIEYLGLKYFLPWVIPRDDWWKGLDDIQLIGNYIDNPELLK